MVNMSLHKHKILIFLITAMVILVAAFMASEPQNRSKGGQRHIIDSLLAAALKEIKPDMKPGKYSANGYDYEILDSMPAERLLNECIERFGSYYDDGEDSYVYLKKIGKGESGETYAKIIIKRDFMVSFYSFIKSKKSIVFLTILLLAAISLYFIFSSYNNSMKAEVESQKYHSMQKLARGLAHEIRNPLNAIHLSLQLIGDGPEINNDNELKECLKIIKDEIKRLDETVARFMHYSKDIKLNKEKIDINDIIKKIIKITAPLFEQKKSAVAFSGAPETTADADGGMVYQVIFNILKNAVEAVNDGGRVKVETASDGGMVIIKISNNGPRIKEKDLPEIFDFYFTTKVEGSGIGLALSKKIIEAHGGAISVKSDEKETEFKIEIPSGI